MFWPRLMAFLLAALAAASAVFWGLKWQGAATSTLPGASASAAPTQPPVNPLALARALGGTGVSGTSNAPPPAVLASSRMALAGVVSGAAQRGTALISVDGKPARPFAVGHTVDGGLLLQSVEPRRVRLAPTLDGPATVTLELPGTKPRP